MRRLWLWLFQNRETGAITIAQAPNLLLWVVIIGSAVDWAWHPAGRPHLVLAIVVKGGLILWALDEILRGVNPWRRCLGLGALAYGIQPLPF